MGAGTRVLTVPADSGKISPGPLPGTPEQYLVGLGAPWGQRGHSLVVLSDQQSPPELCSYHDPVTLPEACERTRGQASRHRKAGHGGLEEEVVPIGSGG